MPSQTRTDTTQPRSNTARQGVAIVLAVLFGFLLITANHTGWIITTVLEREIFVDTLEPLPKDPAVALALAPEVSTEIINSYEVQDSIADALPENLAFIAPPLTKGLEGIITDIVAKIIMSDPFTAVWRASLDTAHRAATVYVGLFDGDVLTEDEGVAVLDFSEIGAQVNEKLDELGFQLLEGRDAELKVELFELPDSGLIRTIVQLMASIRWAVLAATLAMLLITYALATDRRKISLWVGGVTIGAMVLSLVEVRYLGSALTGGIDDPIRLAGAQAALDIVTGRFVAQSWIILVIGAIITFAGWVSGSSERAYSVRSAFISTSRSKRGDDAPSAFAVFVRAHRRLIEWVIVAVTAAVFLFGPMLAIWTIVAFLIVAVVLVVVVEFISASGAEPATDEATVTVDATDGGAA